MNAFLALIIANMNVLIRLARINANAKLDMYLEVTNGVALVRKLKTY